MAQITPLPDLLTATYQASEQAKQLPPKDGYPTITFTCNLGTDKVPLEGFKTVYQLTQIDLTISVNTQKAHIEAQAQEVEKLKILLADRTKTLEALTQQLQDLYSKQKEYGRRQDLELREITRKTNLAVEEREEDTAGMMQMVMDMISRHGNQISQLKNHMSQLKK